MKIIIALLMALLLAALPAGAEENRLIDLGTDEYGNSLYVFGMAVAGDALYVACDQALYVLREGEESFTPCTPEIRLENPYVDGGEEDIDINGVALRSMGDEAPTQQAVNQLQELKLDHDQNSLTFYFSSFEYISTRLVKYSYMLEGYDKYWSEPSGEHSRPLSIFIAGGSGSGKSTISRLVAALSGGI